LTLTLGQGSTLVRMTETAITPPVGGFHIIDGRRIFTHELGVGDPVVVFLPGASAVGLDYLLVQQRVAEFTTAVTYDRGGTGYSDPMPLPRTGEEVARELHALLGDRGPLILVAHSLGGAYAHRFAQLFPGRVAGLVWVEAFHRDWDDFLPPSQSFAASEEMAPDPAQIEAMRDMVRQMAAQLLGDYPESVRGPLADAHASNAWLNVGFAERVTMAALAEELRPGPDLPDVPAIVLTAGGDDPGQAALMSAEQLREMHEGKTRLYESVAGRFTRGEHRVIPGTGHSQIVFERPAEVAQAIRDIVDRVR
jgi:pimeloyl-ACP methyl ester carboxylesterase